MIFKNALLRKKQGESIDLSGAPMLQNRWDFVILKRCGHYCRNCYITCCICYGKDGCNICERKK